MIDGGPLIEGIAALILSIVGMFAVVMAYVRQPAIRPSFDPAAVALLEHEIAFDPVHDLRDTSGIEAACPVCHPPPKPVKISLRSGLTEPTRPPRGSSGVSMIRTGSLVVTGENLQWVSAVSPNRQLSMPHMPGMDVSALTTDELLRIADRMADTAERSPDLATKHAMIELLKVIEAEVKSRKYG